MTVLHIDRYLNKLTFFSAGLIVGALVAEHYRLIQPDTAAQLLAAGLISIAGSDRAAKIAQLLAALGDPGKVVRLAGNKAVIHERSGELPP